MRLIDADALIKAWRKKHNIGEDDLGAAFVGYTEIPRLIDEQPTVDAVPVIRCKDCKFEKDCTQRGFNDDYCSSGRRRGENDV